MNARTQPGTSRSSTMESSSAAGDVSARTARRAAISVPSSSTTAAALPLRTMHARDPRARPDLAPALREPELTSALVRLCAPPFGTP